MLAPCTAWNLNILKIFQVCLVTFSQNNIYVLTRRRGLYKLSCLVATRPHRRIYDQIVWTKRPRFTLTAYYYVYNVESQVSGIVA